MISVGKIGGKADATPEEILADNQRLAGLLDEAQTNTPEDAPADFDALLDDYRATSEAIRDADGDVDAAFAALAEDAPDVIQRLSSSKSHPGAYDFLVDRCGIARP